jgi:competence transcription factor ComK
VRKNHKIKKHKKIIKNIIKSTKLARHFLINSITLSFKTLINKLDGKIILKMKFLPKMTLQVQFQSQKISFPKELFLKMKQLKVKSLINKIKI